MAAEGQPVKVRDHVSPKGKAVKVYTLTPLGKEMAGKAMHFVQQVRNDTLEDVRVALISYIETEGPTDEIESGVRAAIHVVSHMKQEAPKPKMSEVNLDAAVRAAGKPEYCWCGIYNPEHSGPHRSDRGEFAK